MKITRSIGMAQRKADAAEAKRVNRIKKSKERVRRDARMVATLKAGSLPFSPTVMSWVSRQLGKPSKKITAEDIQTLTA